MSLASFFGTDGIRGKVGDFPITPAFARVLGQSVRQWFFRQSLPPHIAIGRDTRRSGKILQNALMEGFGDGKIWDLGVFSTPGIAHATQYLPVAGGISVTASHNSAADNGFKIFDANGNKLSRAQEFQLEEIIRLNFSPGVTCEFQNAGGEIQNYHEKALQNYTQKWRESFPADALSGMRILLDTASGAASDYGSFLLQLLGAEVLAIGNSPDGENINFQCGSEQPENLLQNVKKIHADGGLALDGDGDRALICDSQGQILPGEHLLAALAWRHYEKNPSDSKRLVTTIQANGALDVFCRQRQIAIERCDVGDRNVAEKMAECSIAVGGEPSGHIICNAFGPIADGLFTGAAFFEKLLHRKLWKNRDQAYYFPLFPAIAVNLPVREKIPLTQKPVFYAKFLQIKQNLGSQGNILLRYSGTENRLRLRVEAPQMTQAQFIIDEIVHAWEESER